MQSTCFIRASRESYSKKTAWEGLYRVEVNKRNCLSSCIVEERKERKRREGKGRKGEGEREKQRKPNKREEAWEKEMLALMYDSCRSK